MALPQVDVADEAGVGALVIAGNVVADHPLPDDLQDLGKPRGLETAVHAGDDAVWYSGRDVMTKLRNIEHSGLFIADYDKITNNEINFETILQGLAEQEKEKDRDDFTL